MPASSYVVRVRGRAGDWRDWFRIEANKPHAEEKAEAEFEKLCARSQATEVTYVKVTEESLGHRRGS